MYSILYTRQLVNFKELSSQKEILINSSKTPRIPFYFLIYSRKTFATSCVFLRCTNKRRVILNQMCAAHKSTNFLNNRDIEILRQWKKSYPRQRRKGYTL